MATPANQASQDRLWVSLFALVRRTQGLFGRAWSPFSFPPGRPFVGKLLFLLQKASLFLFECQCLAGARYSSPHTPGKCSTLSQRSELQSLRLAECP